MQQLTVKWAATIGGDVSVTPAVEGNRVYFPDRAGNLYAVDRRPGEVECQHRPRSSGVPGDTARATPAISGDKVIIGTQGPFGGGGKLLAFNKNNGALVWRTMLDSHPPRSSRSRRTVFDGRVYVGARRWRKRSRRSPAIRAALSAAAWWHSIANTGAICWKTYMAPAGYSGNAVWGSSPAIDTKRGQVYIATGNNYSVPPESRLPCRRRPNPVARAACLPADDYFDSILALDLATGAVRGRRRRSTSTLDGRCIPFLGDGANCPEPAGPDFDFGQAPVLFTVKARREREADGPRRSRPEERAVLGARPGHRRGRAG